MVRAVHFNHGDWDRLSNNIHSISKRRVAKMMAKISVLCTLGTDADLFHISKTVTGLCQLEAQNLIELKLKRSPDIGQHSIMLELDHSQVGIDLSDHSDKIQPDLSNCNLYFKRCVRPDDLKHSNRLRSFGLNYSCRSRNSSLRLLTLFGASDVVRRPTVWKKFLCIPLIKEFERKPDNPASPTILFQARLWDPIECPGDEQVNEDRVGLLLTLRREFKERVVGGLVPTTYAQRHHHDLLTTLPSRQSKYVRWAREHLICIGFRGLFGSLGFKIAEALAASQCLISEPTVAYLPIDVPIAKYHSMDECVAKCEHYLSHSEDAKQLRKLAWQYYQSAVEPSAHMNQLLNCVKDG